MACRGCTSRVLMLLLVFAGLTGPASLSAHAAGRRVALVIGNAAYVNVSALTNPGNDAAAIAETLRTIGFDEVREVLDLDQTAFRRALREFTGVASGAETAVIYYAGHGVEVAGRNYLVPVDATLAQATDTEFEAVPLDSLRTAVSGASDLRLVILDACRNNPFVLASVDGTRSVGRGLARVEPGANEIIAYAAREGTVASDGTGGNSPYAASLVKHLRRPGLDVRLLFGEVRDEVMAATGKQQEPFIYGTLGGKPIYLSEPEADATEASTIAPAATSTGSELDKQAADAWIAVKDTTSVGILKTYIARFKGTVFADMAAARLAEIEATTPVEPAPADSDGAQDETAAGGELAVAPDPTSEPAAKDGSHATSGPVPVLPYEPQVFPVGKWAEGAAWDGKKLWVAESGQRSIVALDRAGRQVRRVTVGRLPVGVEADSEGNIYSLQHTDKTVWRTLPGGGPGKRSSQIIECPQDIAVTTDAVWLLAWPDCSSGNAKAVRIDIKTGKQQRTELLGEWGEAIAAAHGAIWVAHVRGGAVSRIDPDSLAVSRLAMDGLSLWDVDANAQLVFAGGRIGDDNAKGVVVAIDPVSLQQVARQDVGEMVLRIVADDRHVAAVGLDGKIWILAADSLRQEIVIEPSVGTYRPSDALLLGDRLIVVAQQLGGDNGAVLAFEGWR